MPGWVACPACNLKHTSRPDGTCPRCKTSIAPPIGPEAPAAATAPSAPPQPMAVPAPVMVERRPDPRPVAVMERRPEPASVPPPIASPIVPGGPAPTVQVTPRAPVSGKPAGPTADLVYRHERPLFAISLSISILSWLVLLVGTLGVVLLYAPFVLLIYAFTQSALIAYVKGTAIKITPRQFPDLHARVTACAEQLGISHVPDCYLLNGQGGFNAFATRFLGRSFVILFSDVVDALEDRPGAVNFYIGHELGHIRRKHLAWRPVLLPAGLLPLLGAAYHRACESTCDRHGAACCAGTQDAVAAITALAAGGKRWKSLSVDEYVVQARESGGFWMSFHELVSDYPWLVKRVARAIAFRDGSDLRLPARNPLAYPFALCVPRAVGGGGGGIVSLLAVVAMIGIIAAIAIPSLLRARVSANEAAAVGDVRSLVDAETSFARQHGRFTSLACLAAQPSCLSRAANPPSLPAVFASSDVRRGYRFQLQLDTERAAAFSYTAVPVTAGETGVRSFCADGSGTIYSSTTAADLSDPQRTTCNADLMRLGGP